MGSRSTNTAIRALVLILTVYAFYTLWSVGVQLDRSRALLAESRREEAALETEIAALRGDLERMGEEETVERLAREKLGLVRPEEIVTYSLGD